MQDLAAAECGCRGTFSRSFSISCHAVSGTISAQHENRLLRVGEIRPSVPRFVEVDQIHGSKFESWNDSDWKWALNQPFYEASRFTAITEQGLRAARGYGSALWALFVVPRIRPALHTSST